MKGVAILILILLILPVISAVEFDMESEFKQGETLMARISGNFIDPVLEENIFLYRGHVRVSASFEVAKINEEYYLYTPLTGKSPNDYSVVIENVKYMAGAEISEEDLTKNFTITNDTADFSIDQGFVVTNNDFFIQVQNLQDYKITINIKTDTTFGTSSGGFFSSLFGDVADTSENSVDVRSGEIKKINFELSDITEATLKTITLSTASLSYDIPVYVFVNESIEEKQKAFKFEPSELIVSIPTNTTKTRVIYLYNTGTETLENITLNISEVLKHYVSLSVEEIDELGEDSNTRVELTLYSDEEKTIEGQIIANSDNLYTYSAVFLSFIEDFVPSDEEGEIPESDQTCEELGGEICGAGQTCDGETISARDDVCCLGECEQPKKSSTGMIVGIILIVVIFGALIWFYKKKYRGVKKAIDLIDIARGKKHKNKRDN